MNFHGFSSKNLGYSSGFFPPFRLCGFHILWIVATFGDLRLMKPVSLGILRAHGVCTPGNRGGLTGSYEVDCQAFLRLRRGKVPKIAPPAFIEEILRGSSASFRPLGTSGAISRKKFNGATNRRVILPFSQNVGKKFTDASEKASITQSAPFTRGIKSSDFPEPCCLYHCLKRDSGVNTFFPLVRKKE